MSLSAQRLQQYFKVAESDQGKEVKQVREHSTSSGDRILSKQKDPALHQDRQESGANKAPFDQVRDDFRM
jgi:hypothetical protein